MAAAITDRTRAVIVCSPNNPTGPIVTQAEFDEFVAAVPADVLVILDEAYAEFVTDPDAVNGLREPGGPSRSERRGPPHLLEGVRARRPARRLRRRPPADPRRGPQRQHPALGHRPCRGGGAREPRRRVRAARARARDRRAARPPRGRPAREPDGASPRRRATSSGSPPAPRRLAVAEAFDAAGLIVRPFAGDGIRISVGEEESVEKVLRIAASVVKDLPEGHPGRGLA